jgi:hypothetical protein
VGIKSQSQSIILSPQTNGKNGGQAGRKQRIDGQLAEEERKENRTRDDSERDQ